MNILSFFRKKKDISGTFIVKTGTVTDDGESLIVFSDDTNRYCEVLPDVRKWYQRWGGIWLFNNPFYEFHPDDAVYFGVEKEQ